MRPVAHFGSFQEMYHFMNAKPEEPKEYVEPKPKKEKPKEEEPKPKKKKGKKNG